MPSAPGASVPADATPSWLGSQTGREANSALGESVASPVAVPSGSLPSPSVGLGSGSASPALPSLSRSVGSTVHAAGRLGAALVPVAALGLLAVSGDGGAGGGRAVRGRDVDEGGDGGADQQGRRGRPDDGLPSPGPAGGDGAVEVVEGPLGGGQLPHRTVQHAAQGHLVQFVGCGCAPVTGEEVGQRADEVVVVRRSGAGAGVLA